MKKLQKIWLLACVLGAMGNGFVSAEETPVYMLDTVNVTAQAYEKKELDQAGGYGSGCLIVVSDFVKMHKNMCYLPVY